MEKVVKKYNLSDERQHQDDLAFWRSKSIEYKLNVLESLRRDAIKLGLYSNQTKHGDEPRLRRVFSIVKQVSS